MTEPTHGNDGEVDSPWAPQPGQPRGHSRPIAAAAPGAYGQPPASTASGVGSSNSSGTYGQPPASAADSVGGTGTLRGPESSAVDGSFGNASPFGSAGSARGSASFGSPGSSGSPVPYGSPGASHGSALFGSAAPFAGPGQPAPPPWLTPQQASFGPGGPYAQPRRRSLRPATIGIIAVAGVVALAVAAAVVLQAMGVWGGSSAKSVAERFASGFMAAETCDDSVLTIMNEDTTASFRGGSTVTCADLSFVPNPAGFSLTVDEVAQGDDSAAATLTMAGSSDATQNGKYTVELVKTDGRWLVNRVEQTFAEANAI